MAKEAREPLSLHADLSDIWGRAAKKSTMFKDLPRLAKRITISVEGWGECVTSGNLTDGIPLTQCLPPGGPIQEGAWTCPVCNQINPPHIWKRCKMCGTLKVQERRTAVGGENEQKHQIANNDATAAVDGSGSGMQFHAGLVVDAQWTDLHFYEARILNISGTTVTVTFPRFPESGNCDVRLDQLRPRTVLSPSRNSEALSTWDAVVNVLSVCAASMDTQEIIDRLQAGVSLLTEDAFPENLAPTVQELMLEHLKSDTRTYRLFQGVHQNILVPGLMALQTKVYSLLQKEGFLAGGPVSLMQDVRGEGGWTVEISVGKETVTVKHFRMEQNCSDSSPVHFMVKWCLTMTFDKNVSKLCSSGVRIEGLKCHPQMAADSKRRIQELVQVGLVIA